MLDSHSGAPGRADDGRLVPGDVAGQPAGRPPSRGSQRREPGRDAESLFDNGHRRGSRGRDPAVRREADSAADGWD
jgi:hypothetical protein